MSAETRAVPKAVLVPGGVYVIGSLDVAEAEAPNPPHEVRLSPFRMGVYPVTNAEYRRFVVATGRDEPTPWSDPRFNAPDKPVIGVSWDSALAFCEWAGGTLPSEAQWEVAARGPRSVRFPWGDEEPSSRHAHFGEDWNLGGTASVSAHPDGVSAFGCHDIAGNVWEWCIDAWSKEAHVERAGLDPVIVAETDVRPLRGGCWRSIEPKLQCAYRNWFHRVAAHITIGFRICYPDDAR